MFIYLFLTARDDAVACPERLNLLEDLCVGIHGSFLQFLVRRLNLSSHITCSFAYKIEFLSYRLDI